MRPGAERRAEKGKKGNREKVKGNPGSTSCRAGMATRLRSTCPGPNETPGGRRGTSGAIPGTVGGTQVPRTSSTRNRRESRAGYSPHSSRRRRLSGHPRNCHSSNPVPTPTRCRAGHASPRHWQKNSPLVLYISIGRHNYLYNSLPGCCRYCSPNCTHVVLPARAAYSHSASVGNRKSPPVLAFNQSMNN